MSVDILFKNLAYQFFAPKSLLRKRYESFKKILSADRSAHIHLARLEEIFYNEKEIDCYGIEEILGKLSSSVSQMVDGIIEISPLKYSALKDYYKKIDFYCKFLISAKYYDTNPPFIFEPSQKGAENILQNLLGGKGYHLYLLAHKLGLPIPRFFIITTNAFFAFLEENRLLPVIKKGLSRVDIYDPRSLDKTCSELKELLSKAKIPRGVKDEIERTLSNYLGKGQRFSIRSSAVAEDSENSFAGQYLTLLDVKREDILDAYKRVLLSKYHPNAVFYRIKKGYCDLETPMAVVVQEMIEPLVAGVVYSSNPYLEGDDSIYIFPATGRGEEVVSGRTSPNRIRVERATKKVAGPGKGLLKERHALKLLDWAIQIENLLGERADLEWCVDQQGNLLLLQARPLTIKRTEEGAMAGGPELDQLSPIVEGGLCASRGISSGKVHIVRNRNELLNTPKGSILVARSIPPEYVVVFERVKAILSERGSSASHSASVAREMGIPFICGIKDVTRRLKEGQLVTVDAIGCRVFSGELASLVQGSATKEQEKDSPRKRLLAQLLKLACQLSLKDPTKDDFRPEGCRSLHDIIRFVHESAMKEMFFLGSKGGGKRGARLLHTGLPITFYVMDVGGGLSSKADRQERITEDAISSLPMVQFLSGLKHPSIDWSRTEHFAWGDFDQVMLAGGIIQRDSFSLASYAILARDYMNLNIRFGYHFVQIDALLSKDPESNYIFFRFSGGGGAPTGRLTRARFLVEVLKALGFEASHTGDLVDSRIHNITEDEMKRVLKELGRLVGATRLMDMYLTQDEDPTKLAQIFLQGRSDFSDNST